MPSDWVPMRWPEEWKDRAMLELVRGTAINCLVAAAKPPFPGAGLQFVSLASSPEGVTLREGLWPRIKTGRESASGAEAGPTGAPWVDSNGWLIRLARAVEPSKTVWLTYESPPDASRLSAESYMLAVAEAESYGARWVLALDKDLRAGLANGNAGARDAWRRIVATFGFFQKHAEWKNWKPVAGLAVVSDFAGAGEFLSHEFLNLVARRHLPCLIVEKSKAAQASLDGLKAVLYMDATPPQGALRSKLLEFAGSGGLLIAPSGVVTSRPVAFEQDHAIHRHGKGRVAVPKQPWEDPYLLAQSVHLLMSRREDVLRLWNAGSMDAQYTGAPDGGKAVVQLLNYTRRPAAHNVTLGLAKRYRSARLNTLGSSTELSPLETRSGTEIALPHFPVYAAIELEG